MKIRFFAMLLAMITIVSSCGKDKNDTGSAAYPKNVGIEYRVTSTTLTTLLEVGFTNEGGGQSTIDGVTLPFSKKFNRTVNQYDPIILKAAANGSGTLKLEILINGKAEVSTPFSGTSTVVGISNYVFN